MSKRIQTWKYHPIENEIINTLLNPENRGEMLTTDLFRMLSNRYQDFTRGSLNQLLFKLEVQGMIFVVPIKKEVSKIEINKNGKFSDNMAKKLKTIYR